MRLPTRTALVTLFSSALLVACGDDESVGTGGGGGAGSSTSSSSSATSSASGPTSSTSSASTGEGAGGGSGGAGGAGGDGGSGGGGEGGAGGGAAFVCQPEASEGAAVTVVTVDENGDEVLVERVLWQDQPADAFWLEPEEATCAAGAPPCAVWEIVEHPAGRIAISSERETEAEPTEACFPYASTFVEIHPSPSRQLVHLTLPTDGMFCIDDETGRSYVNVDHDEEVDETDCLAPPPDVSGRITLEVVDLEGEPVPATMANWYYHPESPEFDGEHPLACADQRCTTWVVTDTPAAGTIYLNATYAGPLNPFVQQGWSGYDGAPFEVEVGGDGEIVPLFAELAVDTTLEGATGGDEHD